MPFKPHYRVFGSTNFGRVIKKPVVQDDKIVIGDVVNTTQTGDHRFGDASIWVPMHKVLIGYIADTKDFDDTKIKQNIHWSEKEKTN